MSEKKSSLLPRILLGVAVGAVAFVVYNRRTLLASIAGPQPAGRLPADRSSVTVDGWPATQVTQGDAIDSTASDTGTSRSLAHMTPTGIQLRGQSIIGQIQFYIATARAQVDTAIAEGQAEAARTRRELEERFVQAKKDPASARSAFTQ